MTGPAFLSAWLRPADRPGSATRHGLCSAVPLAEALQHYSNVLSNLTLSNDEGQRDKKQHTHLTPCSRPLVCCAVPLMRSSCFAHSVPTLPLSAPSTAFTAHEAGLQVQAQGLFLRLWARPSLSQLPALPADMLGPCERDRLARLCTALAASTSDLLCMADHLVKSSQVRDLRLAYHVLQEVDLRLHIREMEDTAPEARSRRRSPICSTDILHPMDLRRLTNIQKVLVQIQHQTGDRVTQGLVGMVLLKVEFLLEPRAW
jgi:hypothetical protein